MRQETQDRLFDYVVAELFEKKGEIECLKQNAMVNKDPIRLIELEEEISVKDQQLTDWEKRYKALEECAHQHEVQRMEQQDEYNKLLGVYKDAKDALDIANKSSQKWQDEYDKIFDELTKFKEQKPQEPENVADLKKQVVSLKMSVAATKRMMNQYIEYAKQHGFTFPGSGEIIKSLSKSQEPEEKKNGEMVPEHEGKPIEYNGIKTPCPYGTTGAGFNVVKVGGTFCSSKCGFCTENDRDQEIVYCTKTSPKQHINTKTAS